MVQSRGTKIIALVALCVAVMGLSIGFAAWTRNLTIKSSAEVKVADNMDVKFVSAAGEEVATVAAKRFKGVAEITDTSDTSVLASDATINNTNSGGPIISGLKATFTAPNQSVTYNLAVKNDGLTPVYLNTVTFNEVTAGNTVVCTAVEGTSQALVNEACTLISAEVSVDGTPYTGSVANIGTVLASGDLHAVVVTLKYADGTKVADGDFNVEFGDIVLTYGTQSSKS